MPSLDDLPRDEIRARVDEVFRAATSSPPWPLRVVQVVCVIGVVWGLWEGLN